MNKITIIAFITAIFLGGCSTTDTHLSRNQNQTTSTDISSTEEVRVNIQELLDAWSHSDKMQAIVELEELGRRFTNSNGSGSWEVAINTAISLCYLEAGDVENFKMAARTLRNYVQPNKRLPRPTQYVLAVDDAIRGVAADENILIESRISGMAHALLNSNGGQK